MCLILLPLSVTAAQPSDLPHRQNADSLATITTDTGAFAPGDKDFSRFTAPGLCIGAVDIATDVSRRSIAIQVAHIFQDSTVTGDSLPRLAVSVARACKKRFVPAAIDTSELKDLFELALMAEDDSVAQVVLKRRLATTSDDKGRLKVLKEALNDYLDAEPGRLAAAESTLVQIDALGTSFQAAKLFAHYTVLHDAFIKFDEAATLRAAQQIIALGQEGPVDAILYDDEPIIQAYVAQAQIAYVAAPDSVMQVIARAKKDLSRFPPSNTWPAGRSSFDPLQRIDYKKATVTAIRDAFIPFNADQYMGAAPPPVHASYWFPKSPVSWPPGDGQLSLVLYGGWLANNCARTDWFLLKVGLLECGVLYTYLPHWAQRYGNRLATTIVAQTGGYAVRSIVLSPAEEGDSLGWFFRDHLQLPITLGVVVDSIWQLPAVDGRQFHFDTTLYGRLIAPPKRDEDSPQIALLYDEHRRLLYLGDLNVPLLQRLIDRAMTVMPIVAKP